MLYRFETDDESTAVAAFLVYAIYRSRDTAKYKISMDMWGQIERFVKSSAKRAEDLPGFIERLKPKLICHTISPKWASTQPDNVAFYQENQITGEWEQVQEVKRREFFTDILNKADDEKVLEVLYKKTALVILLVRDRIEREKPIKFEEVEK